MKNILIFNDFSPEAEHAAELALLLAGKTNTNLYVWNTFDKRENPVAKELAVAHANEEETEITTDHTSWILKLESKLNWETGLLPVVKFIEGVDYAPNHVLSIVSRYDIGMLVRGIAEDESDLLHIKSEALGCSTKSGCPVLLIPQKVNYKAFEKIVYATDLRFCRREIVSFLSQLAKPLNASILIANISAKGLPFMEDNYARTVFSETLLTRANQEHVYFSNIRERNVPRAIDVLVNGMNNDLLVLVNNKFHFNELVGQNMPYIIPTNIHVPLLIFPS
ncbi:MAG: universal stress protein [Mucilaginibacter sp.]|nr:universal stress protein [Mucilaginibacter sp.]